MICKVRLVIEIKSYKASQDEWDNNSHFIFMLGQIQQLFWFQDSRCRYNVPVRLFSKPIQQ